MAHGEYAECPKCGVVARDEEIEEVFGYRYAGTKPQSWCKDCRNSKSDVDDEDEE